LLGELRQLGKRVRVNRRELGCELGELGGGGGDGGAEARRPYAQGGSGEAAVRTNCCGGHRRYPSHR